MVAKRGQWDMRGRTVLISGGTGGIGFETARALARHGTHVIITGRNAGHGEHAATVIRGESGGASVTFIQADHSTVGGNQLLAD